VDALVHAVIDLLPWCGDSGSEASSADVGPAWKWKPDGHGALVVAGNV
jgi:hypothetical protein